MDQRERYLDFPEQFRIAAQAWQARMWTALPGVIKQFPSASGLGPQIADIQPCINGRILNSETGGFDPLLMPVLLDCPVVFQGGGGMQFTFPIKENDECLIILASRCIDAWWQQGFQPPAGGGANAALNPPDLRMHNLSDGFALVGVRSLPKSVSINMAAAELRTDNREMFFSFNPTTFAIQGVAPGGFNLNGVTIDNSGNLTSPATIIGKTDVKNGAGTSLTNHIHGGVTIGGSSTAKPTAGS